MSDWTTVIAALAFGYALGSIPFGLILTRLTGAGDLRSIGSGNIGATNVLRTGRKGLAAATLLLDIGKGLLAVLLVRWCSGGDVLLAALAGFGAFIGHCYPVWLKFRGGKGVATMLGVSFALDWRIGVISSVSWLAMAGLTRFSSVGGMSAAVAAPIAAYALFRLVDPNQFGLDYLFADFDNFLVLTAMAAILIWRHRANIARLRAGTEPKIGGSKA